MAVGHPDVVVGSGHHNTSVAAGSTRCLGESGKEGPVGAELEDSVVGKLTVPDVAAAVDAEPVGVRSVKALRGVVTRSHGVLGVVPEQAKRAGPAVGGPEHAVAVHEATVAAATHVEAGQDCACITVDKIERVVAAEVPCGPDVVVGVHGHVPYLVAFHAHILDDAFVFSSGHASVIIDPSRISPGHDVAQACGSVDDAVSVAILTLPVLLQADLHNGALAPGGLISVAGPHVTALVNGGT